jgi:TonB family protein
MLRRRCPERRLRRFAIFLILASTLSFPRSVAADELDKLLRRPVSPGAVVLLAKHHTDPRVPERLTQALRSKDPATRGVAARVIALSALSDLLPAVAEILTNESDADAAREEIRTFVSLGGYAYDEMILAAARRFEPKLDRDLVRILARVRGVQAFGLYFQSLRDLALSPYDREVFFKIAIRGERAHLVAASSKASGRGDSEAWQAILNVAADLDLKLEEPILVSALSSENTVIRGEAAWYLAKAHCESPPQETGTILAALAQAPATEGMTADPELRFGAEILARVLGRPAVEDEAWMACLETNPECHLDSDFEDSPLVSFLTPRERAALTRRNQANRPEETRGKFIKSLPAPKSTDLRLVSGLPTGLARDLFEVESCRSSPSKRLFSVAEMEFRADGVPRHISVVVAPTFDTCRRAAESLFLMALGPEDEPVAPGKLFAYVAPFDPEGLSCAEGSPHTAPDRHTPGVVRVRAKVVPPKLTNRVQPNYPEVARQERQEGVTIYEAVITRDGCLRDLRVVKSSAILLDLAGMHALARWKYEPATLDGRAVSVYLTVTVTFNLK